MACHCRLELGPEAEDVVDHHGVQPVEAALEAVDPGGGALQAVGGADVVHEEPVEVAHQRLGVEVAGEQPGVDRGGAAVAADVEVPALLGGDHAEVLAPGLAHSRAQPLTPPLSLWGERSPR